MNAALVVRELEDLSPAEVVARALVVADELDGEKALEAERQTEAVRLYQQQRHEEGKARACAVLALCLARRVGAILPPPSKGGRGNRVEGAFELDARRRADYRLMAELSDDEFREWLLKVKRMPSKRALVSYARKLRLRSQGDDLRAPWVRRVTRRLGSLLDLLAEAPTERTDLASRLGDPITQALDIAEEEADE